MTASSASQDAINANAQIDNEVSAINEKEIIKEIEKIDFSSLQNTQVSIYDALFCFMLNVFTQLSFKNFFHQTNFCLHFRTSFNFFIILSFFVSPVLYSFVVFRLYQKEVKNQKSPQ